MPPLSERLKERKKELNCLYLLDELLKDRECDIENIFWRMIDIIPPSWQFSEICRAKICFEGRSFAHHDYKDSQWFQTAELIVDDTITGDIRVVYLEPVIPSHDCPFLPEEQKLLNAIASMLSRAIFHRRLGITLELLQSGENKATRKPILLSSPDKHWKWRDRIAALVVSKLDMVRFGVEAVYLFGSTEESTAGPGSDIDLLVHFSGNPEQRYRLEAWLQGWSLCLAEMNLSKTGYRTDGLLDVHIVTDKDIEQKTSYAVMIDGLNKPARLLRSKNETSVQEQGAA
jgi:hypothetical protein